jgi:tRNA 2-thiouridine synthesizing protein D
MRILVIVSSSPWGCARPSAALRFVRAALAGGERVPAVFFHDDGVYNALPGTLSDDGLASPQAGWRSLAAEFGLDLLLCPAAAGRRLPESASGDLAPFREEGLARLVELLYESDRVVRF